MAEDSKKQIVIKGAREHNLQDIDVSVPRDEFIVITGLSGSGKSSLAFDTIYAEGQRRYVESLSAYARQFLGQMKKPEMESIEGLSPAISIDQKTTRENPRSTVGTITEIYDYLRLLFARIGIPHCPNCGKEVSHQTIGQIGESIIEEGEGIKIQILSPIVRDKKGQFKDVLEDLRNKGFVRVRVDGEIRDLDEDIELAKTYRHNIDVVVDRLKTRKDVDFKRRLVDSLETAAEFTEGLVSVLFDNGEEEYEKKYSEHFACVDCGIDESDYYDLLFQKSPDLIVPDKTLTLNEGAIAPWSKSSKRENYYYQMLEAVSKHFNFSMDVPFNELDPEYQDTILYGCNDKIPFTFKRRNKSYMVNRKFEGVIPRMERLYLETKSNYSRKYISKFMSDRKCHVCDGKRLRPEILAVTVGGKSIIDVCQGFISILPGFGTD